MPATACVHGGTLQIAELDTRDDQGRHAAAAGAAEHIPERGLRSAAEVLLVAHVQPRQTVTEIHIQIAGGDAGVLKALLDMRDKESRRMASLATKLRITNQSRYTPQSAATAAKRGGGGKVWQFGKTGG